ncbi:MAG: SAM-dependent methyltransferase [Nocardioidaceae bacterium]
MASGGWVTWRAAWTQALYGPTGFYRRQRPADHFRTSVHASPLFAQVVVSLVRRLGVHHVTDYGAGGGELLAQIRALAPDLGLTGVELRQRPSDLPPEVNWVGQLPDQVWGLLIANELLDNVPCDVVELDNRQVVRVVEIQPDTGVERLGAPIDPTGLEWLGRWWPVDRPGQRAEVGFARDRAWSGACARLGRGAALLIDYGHQRDSRPPAGTLASYRNGRQTPATPDGRHDLTAHVAVDSVAAAVGGQMKTQRQMLHELGVISRRPPVTTARHQPAGYLRALSTAGAVAELTAQPGLGDFWWLLTPR